MKEEEESFVISVIYNDRKITTESKRSVDIGEWDSDIGGKVKYNDSFM